MTLGLIRNYFIFSFKAQVTSPGFLTFTFQRFFLIQFSLDRLETRIIKVFKKSVSRTIHSSYQKTTEKKKVLRSEEHTSELQSRLHLVCRLLLEKKKKHEKDTTSRLHAH